MIKIITDATEEVAMSLFWSLVYTNKDNLKNIEVYTNNNIECKSKFVSMINFKDKKDFVQEKDDIVVILPNYVIIKNCLSSVLLESGIYKLLGLSPIQEYLADALYSGDYKINTVDKKYEGILVIKNNDISNKIIDKYCFVAIMGYENGDVYYDIFNTGNK